MQSTLHNYFSTARHERFSRFDEIEKKFAVRELPAGIEQYPSYEIEQGYLAVDPNGTHIRLRRSDEELCLTVKKGKGASRKEFNIPVDSDVFEELWQLTAGKRLRKTRYDVPYGALTIEIDIYHGRNEGITVAEVEFPDAQTCDQFIPPAWLGPEISDFGGFGNVSLARE